MSTVSPLVTVAIPTYNRSAYLLLAIESVLSQTYPNIEIIVADNASTDETEKVLASFEKNIRAVRHSENRGMAANWQACLDIASGEYFLLLSDDDFLEPGAIDALIRPFQGTDANDLAFVYGRSVVFCAGDENDQCLFASPPTSESPAEFICASYKGNRFSPTGAILYRTSDLQQTGGFVKGGYLLVLDAAAMMRVVLMKPERSIFFSDTHVFNYRLHATNATTLVSLDQWANELTQLFSYVSITFLSLHFDLSDVKRSFNSYFIRFIFQTATPRKAPFIKRMQILQCCFCICAPYIGFLSLPVVLKGVIKIIFPKMIIVKLKLLRETIFH